MASVEGDKNYSDVVGELSSLKERVSALTAQLEALGTENRRLKLENETLVRKNTQPQQHSTVRFTASKNTLEKEKSEEQDIGSSKAFRTIFDRLDHDRNGTITRAQLEQALADVPELTLAQSKKLLKVREELKDSTIDCIDFPTFQEIAMDHFHNSYKSLFSSQNLNEDFAKCMMHHVDAGTFPVFTGEFDSLVPLASIASQTQYTDDDRLSAIQQICSEVFPKFAEDIVSNMCGREKFEQEQEQFEKSKFIDMFLAPTEQFLLGPEAICGMPSLQDPLEAMRQEHCEGAAAVKEFKAWNNGRERTTTPKEEWGKMLPDGTRGKLFGHLYNGEGDWIDFEKHPMAIKAGVKKDGLVALRLYTGPMFKVYNDLLRYRSRRIEERAQRLSSAAARCRAKLQTTVEDLLGRHDSYKQRVAQGAEPGVEPAGGLELLVVVRGRREECEVEDREPFGEGSGAAKSVPGPASVGEAELQEGEAVRGRAQNAWRNATVAGTEAGRVLVEYEDESRALLERRDVELRGPLEPRGRSDGEAWSGTVRFRESYNSFAYKLGCPAGCRAYYELKVLDRPVLGRFGFMTSLFERSEDTTVADPSDWMAPRPQCVGDDAQSWALNENSAVLHGGDFIAEGVPWRVGDVIGLAVDRVGHRVLVSVNGEFSSPVGTSWSLGAAASHPMLFAAFSGHAGAVQYNCGEGGRFNFAPPPGFSSLWAAACSLPMTDAVASVRAFEEQDSLMRGTRELLSAAAADALLSAEQLAGVPEEERLSRAGVAKLVERVCKAAGERREEGEGGDLGADYRALRRATLGGWFVGDEEVEATLAAAPGEAQAFLEAGGRVLRVSVQRGLVSRKEARAYFAVAAAGELWRDGTGVKSALDFVAQRCKDREDAIQITAARMTLAEEGPFPFATTVHVINSALIRIGRITPLPEGSAVFRGFAGLNLARRLVEPDEFGCRCGTEPGFMSTSTDKDQAIGYIRNDSGQKQLFVIRCGKVDRGADLDWISVFKGEKEILMPPLSSLEVEGAPWYEDTAKGRVMVWPLRLNVNLKGRTMEEYRGVRKELLVQAAECTLHETEAGLLTVKDRPEAKRKMEGSGGEPMSMMMLMMGGGYNHDREANVDRMLLSIQKQCASQVEALRKVPANECNDDCTYKALLQRVIDMKQDAEGLVDYWLCGVENFGADSVSKLTLQEARQRLQTHLETQREQAKSEGDTEKLRRAALKLCKMKKVISTGVEEREAPKDDTPLLHWARQGFLLAVRLLVDAGADAAVTNGEGDTPLHLALKCGYLEVANSLMDARCPVNAQNTGEQQTPLHLAIKFGYSDFARELLRQKANPDCKDKFGNTALCLAVQVGKADISRLLIEAGARVNVLGQHRYSPLFFAAKEQRNDIVALLVSAGAQDLHAAAQLGDAAMTKTLLSQNANVDDQNAYDQTPLHVAVRGGQIQGAKLLLQANADVELPGDMEETAVHIACRQQHVEVLELLVEFEGDLRKLTAGGDTTTHLAAGAGAIECLQLISRSVGLSSAQNMDGIRPVDMLSEVPNPKLSDATSRATVQFIKQNTQQEWDTELHEALKRDDRRAATTIVKASDAWDAQNDTGDAALHWAALRNVPDVMASLIDSGCALDRPNSDGNTAAHLACQEGHYACLELLAAAAADLTVPNNDGNSPSHLAAQLGSEQCIEVLARSKCLTAYLNNEGKRPVDMVSAGNAALAEFVKENTPGTALHAALQRNRVGEAMELVYAVSINAMDGEGKTALFLAVEQDNLDVVSTLIAENAELGARCTPRSQTALLLAARGEKQELVEALTGAGAADLHSAVVLGDESMLAKLITMGVDVNERCGRKTALHSALELERDSFVELLKSGGAADLHSAALQGDAGMAASLLKQTPDLGCRDDLNRTALQVAVEQGSENVAQLLVDAKARLNLHDRVGNTPLHVAVKKSLHSVVSVLVSAGACLNQRNKDRKTPTYLAVEASDLPSLEALLQGRPDLTLWCGPEKFGYTAVHVACGKGHVAALQSLIAAGADLERPSRDTATPLLVATIFGQIEAVRALVEAGADREKRTKLGTAMEFAVKSPQIRDEEVRAEIVALLQK